jgi:tetratricopeptide (TPR) repeat protein
LGSQADYTASAEQIAYYLDSGNFDSDRYMASRDANQEGEKLLRSGKPEEAKAIFAAAIQSDPRDFRALNNLGLVAWYESDFAKALELFSACLAVRPIWLDAAVNAFDTALALGRIDGLMPILDRALSLGSPDREIFASMRAEILANGPAIYSAANFEELQANARTLKKAEEAASAAKLSEAISIYLDALKARPKNPQALNGLGIIAFGEKRYDDAFGLFESAAGMHPLDQDILMNLWECAQALRRESDVLPKLRLSLEQNPALEDVRAVIKEFA